jgi:diphthamide synthase (EF-2-diphthine--ammonia ligase)
VKRSETTKLPSSNAPQNPTRYHIPMPRKPILLSWSGGKDSAWALHLLQQSPDYEVVGLLTTINQHFGRVAMHGFRESLLDLQSEAIGLPLWKVPLPWPCSNEVYEAAMAKACARAVAENLHGIAFGDLFLEDIRDYRIAKLAPTGLEPIFPCWLIPTDQLARDMIASGLRAHLTCVDPRCFPNADARTFAGREFTPQLLADLPSTVDPCGERGEFHTFVSAGPMFRPACSIKLTVGETVDRDGFLYADLLPASTP